MKAVVFTEYGPPDVLRLTEVPKPVPGDNEVLIRVRAVHINFGDLLVRNMRAVTLRNFTMPGPLWLPTRLTFGWRKPRLQILGSEFSGDVEVVGKSVTKLKVGDAVMGYLGPTMGANAEYVRMAADKLVVTKPTNVSYEEAATLSYGTLTALSLLQRARIQPGQKVLINGASGSIGMGALQLARHYGAEVTGVASTPRLDYLRSIGADHVIDYTREDFTRSGKTYDLIVDVMGRSSFGRCKSSLNADGRYLLASFKMKHLFQMLLTSFTGGKKVICALSSESQEKLQQIRDLIEAGVLKTTIDRTFTLEEAAEAHRYAESGQKSGSIVLTVAVPEPAF